MIDAQEVTERVAAGVGVSPLPTATARVDATPGSSRAVGVIEVPEQPDRVVTTWATVGASRFASGYRTNDGRPIGVEFIAAVGAGLTVFGDVVAAAAFQVGPPNDVRPGTVYRNAVKDRYPEASTPHLLSVPPFLWSEFFPYSDEDVYVTWLQLIPVSEDEAEFCVTRGFGALDEAFERAQPDLFSIERPSVELPRGQ